MESSEKTVNGWNQHAKLVLSELKRLDQKLESIDKNLEEKLDKHLESIKDEVKEIDKTVNELQVSLAVLKKDVALKTTGIAFGISFFISILLKFIGKI